MGDAYIKSRWENISKIVFVILIVAFPSIQLFSQSVQGQILNKENNEPVTHANISVKNSTQGTTTDTNGFFSLEISGKDELTLRISCIGFQTIEIGAEKFKDGKTFKILLQPISVQLNKSIVVTASKKERVSFETPDAVSVITRKELETSAPRSMAEALIGATGVWMQKTNHGGGSPFLRGLTGNQTLLLIDGIRLNNSTYRYGPNQYFNTLDIFSVERVEVIRGKGSVLYGSDALGGVINVITRSPQYFAGKPRIGGRGNLKYMNRGMEKSGLGELVFQSKNFAISGNTNYKNFGDVFAGGNLGFERPSGYNEIGVNLNAKLRLTDNWQISSAFQYLVQNDVHRYDQVVQRGYYIYKYDPQIHRLAYLKMDHFSNNLLLKKINVTVSHQLSDETRKFQKENSSLYQKENDVVTTYGFSAEIWSEFTNFWEAVSGAELYMDEVNSGKTQINFETEEELLLRGLYPDNSDMQNLAFYSQHTMRWEKMHLNFGGRYNTFRIHSVDEEFGEVILSPNSLVGNLALQFFTSPARQIILSAHSAFRAPNINDISTFGLFDYGIEIPSTDLLPEKTFTLEGGLKKTGDQFSLAVIAFHTWLYNQILRVETTYNGSDYIDGERVYKKMNIARSNITGIEFDSGLKLNPQFSFINNLTWIYGKNIENGEPMRRIPPINGKIAFQYSKSKVFSEIEFLFAAKQDRLSSGDIDDHRIPEGGTPGWNILNFKFGYSLKNISVNSGLQNLFNQSYRIHGSGIDGYGRSFWLTLRFRINDL